MSKCSKCGSELGTKRADLVTGLCWDCREKTHGYCNGCRCYGIIDDRCYVCRPDPTWAEGQLVIGPNKPIKVYGKNEQCPCGIQAASCEYHAPKN